MKSRILLVAIIVLLALSGCQGGNTASMVSTGVAATLVAGKAQTAEVSDTPVVPTATRTRQPTKTPVPTIANTPTPELPMPAVVIDRLVGPEIIGVDWMDGTRSSDWSFDAGTLRDGELVVYGKNWNGLMRNIKMPEGQGFLMDFTYTKGSEFEVYIANGTFDTAEYKRFGIYVNNNVPGANLWLGKQPTGNALVGDLRLVPDHWYTMMMVAGPNGDFMALIWDPADPSRVVRYREVVSRWANTEWDFAIGANLGEIHFDNLVDISFSTIQQ